MQINFDVLKKILFFIFIVLIIYILNYNFQSFSNMEQLSIIHILKQQIFEINTIINKKIPEILTEYNTNKNINTFLYSIFIAFLYGFFHTIGPGHGKTIIINYFVTKKTKLHKCLHIGFLIGIFHVISSIIIIFILDIALNQIFNNQASNYINNIKILSYSIILIIGVYLLTNSIINFYRKKNHKNCICCNHENSNKKEEFSLSLSIGMVPCVGSLIILLYSIANGILIFGVIMVAFIAIGMGIALTIFGIISRFGHQKILNTFNKNNKNISIIIEIIGNLMLIVISIISLMIYI